MENVFVAYSDGSCDNLHPQRPGGAAYIILDSQGNVYRQASKGFVNTTNNRMEFLAVISIINALPEKASVTIYTDSQYVIEAAYSKKPKKNLDLCRRFKLLVRKLRECKLVWVKGHAGIKYNELCDQMANSEYEKQLYLLSKKHDRT